MRTVAFRKKDGLKTQNECFKRLYARRFASVRHGEPKSRCPQHKTVNLWEPLFCEEGFCLEAGTSQTTFAGFERGLFVYGFCFEVDSDEFQKQQWGPVCRSQDAQHEKQPSPKSSSNFGQGGPASMGCVCSLETLNQH